MFEHELRCRPNCPANSSVDSHFSSFQGFFYMKVFALFRNNMFQCINILYILRLKTIFFVIKKENSPHHYPG